MYHGSYGGKGSLSKSSKSYHVSGPIRTITNLLAEIEDKTYEVEVAKTRLEKAEQDLEITKNKLYEKMASLDPSTRDLLTSMLEPKGKVR